MLDCDFVGSIWPFRNKTLGEQFAHHLKRPRSDIGFLGQVAHLNELISELARFLALPVVIDIALFLGPFKPPDLLPAKVFVLDPLLMEPERPSHVRNGPSLHSR